MLFKSCYKNKYILLFVILYIFVCCNLFAVKPEERENSVTVIANPGKNGWAIIGSQIQASIIFTSDGQNTAGAVDFNGVTNPGEDQLALTQINGSNLYLGITNAAGNNALTVVPGNIDGAVTGKFVLTNSDGTEEYTSVSINVDNEPPLRNGVASCTVNGRQYTSGMALTSGQVATITQKVTSNDIESVQVCLEDIGLGTFTMNLKGEKTYVTTFIVPDNIDNTVCTCVVTLTDDAGNTTVYTGVDTLRLMIDSRAPDFVIAQTTITSSNANPNLAKPGDTLTFTAVIENYDNDSVTVTSSELKNNHGTTFDDSKLPTNLVVNATPAQGAQATFRGTLQLPTDPTCYYDNTLAFQFTATDDAGNKITREVTFAGIVDLGEFLHSDAMVQAYSENNVKIPVATATSQLYFSSFVSTTATESTTVVVDLTPIGVNASMPLLFNEDLNRFIATYSGGLNNISLDGQYVIFVITATDRNGAVLQRMTTPSLMIDNVAPQIDAFTITGATGTDGSIINKDILTMLATVSGANDYLHPVFVDFTSLDNSGIHDFTNSSGNQWRCVCTVATGTIDRDYDFVLEAHDNHGNHSRTTLTMKVDNEPPIWVSQESRLNGTLINNDSSDPFVIIGDVVNLKVTLDNEVDDGISVVIDLSSLGNYSQETMTKIGKDYTFTFDVATGTINNGIVFPMTILDNAGNTVINKATGEPMVASFPFPTLDQNPPDPQEVIITLTNHSNTEDKFPTSINTKKTIDFVLPFIREATNDDSATCTLDVTYLCKLTDGTMNYIDNTNLASVTGPTNFISMEKSAGYYHSRIVATDSVGLEEQSDYIFNLVMYDISGNKVAVESDVIKRVDLNPPVITSILVGTPGGGSVLKIGDTFTIKVYVYGNDGMPPVINLSSLNPELSEEIMNQDSVGVYSYNATIASGDIDNLVASWAITVSDGCDNSVTSYTRELLIDNKPPEAKSFLITGDSITEHQRINYTDNRTNPITLELIASESITVTYDLSAIGGSPTQSVSETISGGDYVYTFVATTTLTAEEYEDYEFTATIKDNHGNTTTVKSQKIKTVDCLVPIINSSLCGAEISARNDGLLPPKNSNIARIGDTITFYASMTSGLDAVASVSFSIDPGVATITKQMEYNSDMNRHEMSFVIKAPGAVEGGGTWGSLNLDEFAYIISVVDDAANVATPTSGITTFVAKNVYPSIASYSLVIDPDHEKTGILNIGSGTNRLTRDLLVASATLSDGAIIGTAALDLSSLGGDSNYILASITNSLVNNTGNGLDIASFIQTDYRSVYIPISIYDEAGYPCGAIHELSLDTKAPEVTSVTFDGKNLTISFSEDIYNINESKWFLVGSATIPIGATSKLDLSDTSLASWTDNFYEVVVTLGLDGQKEVANWASSPLYLEVRRDEDVAAATDNYGNWIASYSAFPITITDYTWREAPSIVNFSMTHNWPTKISFNIEFSQEMNKATFVASDAVIYVNEPSDGRTEFHDVAYDSWYVIQQADTCVWTDNKNLRIILCDSGRDWIANRLTQNPDSTLKFAQKSSANKMVKSILDKDLKLYTIESPYIIADNRQTTPIPALNILSDPVPTINLTGANLKLTFSDRVWLFSDSYRTENELKPEMGLPSITNQKGSNLHLNKITLFDLDDESKSIQLSCGSITTTLNDYASTTVNVSLTENDIVKIMDYYNISSPTNWGLQVNEDSFINMWGMGNTRYKPSSPGAVDVVETVPDETPSLIAVSVTDMPPTKEDVGNFTIDFEVTKFKAGANPIPFSTTESNNPTAAIFETSTGDRIASASFEGWSTRTVRNTERTIVTFKTSEDFTKEVDGVEAELRLYGLKDVFGDESPVLIASYVYDRTKQSETSVTGFSTASAAFIIDNVAPTATDVGPVLLGTLEAGRDDFYVDYSETMDTAYNPSLVLATSAATISFTFSRWENSDTRAVFTIDEPITATTINGTWSYELSGGQDLAGNAFVSSTTYMLIRSEVPKIVANSIQLNSIRNTIDINTVVAGKPLNFDASPDYTKISFKYQSEDTENLPHTLCLYNSSDVQIGSATITQDGVNATATITAGDFTSIPTTNSTISIKIIDIANNITDVVGSIDYYATAPDVATMSLSGAATYSQGIYYYSSTLDNMTFKARLNGNYNKPLNLLVASYSIPMSPVATMTLSTTTPSSSIYTDSFGWGFSDNLYTVMLADEAGNLHTNAAPLMFIVDNVPPSVESILPGPDDRIANTATGMATFTVKFAELMDTSSTPHLVLATTTYSTYIEMNFVGWGDDMMTASFTNAMPIGTSLPVGVYNYQVYEARDLAGNWIDSTPATCTTDVQPIGPGVREMTVLTLQPDISDEVLENRPFNPVKYNTGNSASVTFKLDYVSGPFNTPHRLLIFNESNENIATLTVSEANPGYATWRVADGIPEANATYTFKIVDVLENCSPDTGGYLKWTFKTDITVPDVTDIAFDDGDVGENTGGIKYYSSANPATFTVTTTETEDLLLIASSTATTTYIISASDSYTISFGSALPDGKYTLTVSDLAGNINDTASIAIIVDSIPPQVMGAYASDETYNPLTVIGKTAMFLVTFDEAMNTNVNPTLLLATDTGDVATLTFDAWLDDQRCTFVTDNIFDTISFPVGTASIIVSGAKDLAGNIVATATYGEVEVISESPDFSSTLTTKQILLTDDSFTNTAFSFRVEPNIATLTIEYATGKGPYALDHTLLLFDNTGVQIATHTLVDGMTEITVNEDFFGDFTPSIAAPIEYAGTFTIKLIDSVGNIATDSNNFVLNYDSILPKVTSLTLTGVSSASSDLVYYYNPDILGSLTANINLNASDALRLVVFGVSSPTSDIVATRTYNMSISDTTYIYNGKLTDTTNADIPEGTYTITAVDMAGNFAVLATDDSIGASRTVLIDKTAPEVLVATITEQLYLNSGEAGMATFSVQFNESLFDEAYQYLEIATTSYSIPCRLVRIETTAIASDTAIFETAVAVQNMIPQGTYVYHIFGTDLTGNRVEVDFGEISIKSGGPIVSSVKTISYQETTASATLESGEEYHYDDVFSFNVYPNAATMSIVLSDEPDGDPSTIYVTFLKKEIINQITQEVFVASYAVAVDANYMATFTWNAVTEPIVATSASFIIRLADVNGDLSYYAHNWSVDSEAPTFSTLAFNGGVDFPASGVVYLNPYRHTNFEVIFRDVVENTPKLRVRSSISTDTYALNSTSNNSWKTAFRAKYSRDTGNPDDLMPDGVYDIGLVDQAGNVAASDTEDLYQMIIDTKAPEIGTITLKINGITVGQNCAPSETRPLIISLETEEPATATGAYYVDVYNSGGVRINRINIVDNAGNLEASWDAKDSSGKTVTDGVYTFKVSDICGNTSVNATSTNAITAPFKAMNPAVQTGSNTVKLWFNHSIDPGSLGATPFSIKPSITISNIQIEDERALTFIANGMTHGASYTLTVGNDLRNIYGDSISPTASSAVFFADVKGPSIVNTSFENVNTQSDIVIIFDQILDKESGESPSSYVIKDASGNTIPISYVIMQPDNQSVMICASGTFIENAIYTIQAPGVKDELGNNACETSLTGFSFRGRDVTPPEFTIAAFSNAANENDIIVVALSNEELLREPKLTIIHGTASPITMTMQKNSSNNLAFMAAASLKSSNGQSGTLKVEGEDLNGNKGGSSNSFAIATVAPNTSARLTYDDKQFSLIFNEDSLKSKATVKILKRSIIKDETATGTIQTALQNEYTKMRGLRASVASADEEAANSELTPITDAYEASILSSKVNKGVVAALKVPETASQTPGLGLFYQKNGSWKFISANITSDKEIKAKITSNQVFAIMQDSVGPTIKLDESIDLSKAFETARPEFVGNIKDYGSGLDTNSLEAKIDSKLQNLSVDANGNFKFKSLSELINGKHDLTITAKDRTGNTASTGSMRFALVLPFEFKQIIQYPNPARNNVTIRIRTNSTEVNCHIRVKIYDVAGHKVADFDENDVNDKGDGNYELRWDLCNKKGKKVANGVYIARLEAINPETGKKVKSTLKIAVLK